MEDAADSEMKTLKFLGPAVMVILAGCTPATPYLMYRAKQA